MRYSTIFTWLAAVTSAGAKTTVWATPHDSYSSSVGVLGCKINTDRVAYWPQSISCDNICVQLSYADRSVYLLRIDQSGGAYDVSYDAWNYLMTGESATKKPTAGGATAMEYQDVAMSNCKDLITTKDKKLALSAANSMNFLSSCLADKDSWVAENYALYNIMDPICTMGYDEVCTLDLSVSNQAKCPNTLGVPNPLKSAPVYNIRYPSGEKVLAGSTSATVPAASSGQKAVQSDDRWQGALVLAIAFGVYMV
jgi:hypothetical protein